MEPSPVYIEECVARALCEDLGAPPDDLTTRLSVLRPRNARARIVAKADGVVCGVAVAAATIRSCDASARIDVACEDGARIAPGDEVLRIEGDAAGLLAAERTALNFLQRLSGIATLTRRFVDAIAGTGTHILDTRKTTPGLRALEKYAVSVGGGVNHRFGLFDQVLLKENHFTCAAPDPYEEVVRRAVRGSPAERAVVAEARDVDEALAAVRGGAGVVMLDNFRVGEALRAAVAAVRSEAERLGRSVAIEISGGVDLDNVAAYGACGVDRISVGALTHSARALDLSMLVEVSR